MPKRIIKKMGKIASRSSKSSKKKPKKRRKKRKKHTKKRIKKKINNIKEQAYLKRQEHVLKRKKKSLEKQLSQFARQRKSVKGDYKARFPTFGRGKDEDAQEVTSYESRLTREHQLESEIEKVQNALDKIKNGKYGICNDCGKQISKKRLKIYPEANHCMKCHKKKVN